MQRHQSAVLLGFARSPAVVYGAISDQLPFCSALAIECHQQRSDLPLRQVDFVDRSLGQLRTLPLNSGGKKMYPTLNLDTVMLYLE